MFLALPDRRPPTSNPCPHGTDAKQMETVTGSSMDCLPPSSHHTLFSQREPSLNRSSSRATLEGASATPEVSRGHQCRVEPGVGPCSRRRIEGYSMPRTMRAVRKVEPRPGLRLDEVPVPQPGEDEVLVRVE